MKAINGKTAESCPNPGSTKRLRQYYERLTTESGKRVYDDRVVEVLMRYARKTQVELVRRELRYLDNLRDPKGRPFCRSTGKYSDVEEQMVFFTREDKPSFAWNVHFQHAVGKVSARYPKNLKMLEYLTDEDIHDAVTDWSTSAGYEGIVTGNRKKRDYLTGIHSELGKREQEAVKQGRYTEPLALTTRTQAGGMYDDAGKHTNTCKMKMRAVEMDSVYSVCTACRVGVPITEFLRYYKYSAIGKDDHKIRRQINIWRNKATGYISLDYSKYDSTIPAWLLRYAFKVLRGCFAFRNRHEEELFDVIEETFIRKTFLLPEGRKSITHGTPSGSRLTALINGICNEIITETWMDKFHVQAEYMIMGDDNLIYLYWTGDSTRLLRDVSEYIGHNFGIKVNVDKSNTGTSFKDPEFLSRFWAVSGPWRWKGEVVSLLAYPEKFRPYDWTELTPELVMYAYILAYERTMREMMDVDRFLRDNKLDFLKALGSVEVRKQLPWNVRNSFEVDRKVRKCIKSHEAEKRSMVR